LTPLLLAAGASLTWGFGDFFGPLLSRTAGMLPVLFWAEIGGCAGIAVAVAVRGNGPHGPQVLYAVAAAVAGTLGLFAYYRGMVVGAISVVAPIAGVSAVIPVLYGIATGDHPTSAQLGGIACALMGVALASTEKHEGGRTVAAGVGLALLAACGFGNYFPWMHAAAKVDFWWASLVFRLIALAFVGSVVAARRAPVMLSRRNAVVAGSVGLLDQVGNVFFAASSQHGLVSLTAVLASFYPVVTVLLAAAVVHERVARLQRAGILLTLLGVALISA
jgi:drug/metabolite transporter (DMT)-like permease